MGRNTQGVRLINLAKKNDVIASVCKVMSSDDEAVAEHKSRETFERNNEAFKTETGQPEGIAGHTDAEDITDATLVDFGEDEEDNK